MLNKVKIYSKTIGGFFKIGQRAILLGKFSIAYNTFIGAGAIVLPDICIGDDCTVGAGSVVTKNITNNLLVKGNPAK